jgi:hypothetical protein
MFQLQGQFQKIQVLKSTSLFLHGGNSVGMPEHFPGLDDGGECKNAANDRMYDLLVVPQFANQQLTAQNEQGVTDERPETNARDIGIEMTFTGFQHSLAEQYRAPAKPERNLNRIHRTHETAKPETV